MAGLSSIIDLRGRSDLFGNLLRVSEEAIADELASAASLIQGQADEGLPVVLIEGYQTNSPYVPASGLIPKRTICFDSLPCAKSINALKISHKMVRL